MNIWKTEIPNCVGQSKQATIRLDRDTNAFFLQTVLIKLPSIFDNNETIHNNYKKLFIITKLFTVMKFVSNLSLDLQQF